GELSSEIRHEYVDGEVYAMAGAGEAHNLIALNIASKLREFVRGGPCRVFISDMKLHVKTWKAYYYPDVMVTCDPADSQSHFKELPSLIVEVLSPSTESTDRREKMLAYRTLASLREYVLVAADKRQVEIYRRDEQDEWQLAVINDHGKKAVLNNEIHHDRFPQLNPLPQAGEEAKESLCEFYVNDGECLSLASVACRLTLDEIYEDVRLDASPAK
ncbi:MAG: Uma2 family endonuclease, partial [Gallionella sp.]|nr:Uma2 family endonuclease [Gallionella sp.]